MFEFLKNKKSGRLLKNVLSGCFVFLIIAMISYGAFVPQTVHASSLTDLAELVSAPIDKVVGAVTSAIVGIYASVAISTTALLLWISAELLETVIKYSVLNLHSYIGPDSAIATTWKVLRDFGNMFFIFILLYTAIMTILGMGGGDIKKIIARVVIFALLINFSFFFTKIAIDASNVVTVAFYRQIVDTPCGSAGTSVNIGGAFMCHLGLTKILSSDIIPSVLGNGIDGTQAMIRLGTFGSALLFIMAVILAAAAIMFLVRLVTIFLLLVFSPLAFASMAFPDDSFSKKWTKPLFSACISAPVYMIMTWVSLKLAAAITANQNGSIIDLIKTPSLFSNGGLSAAVSQNLGAALNYFVIAALMIASILIAKELGLAGSDWAMKTLQSSQKWAQGKLGNVTAGAAGYIGRRTVGVAGRSIADGKIGLFGKELNLKDIQKKGGFAGSLAGSVRNVGKSVAESSFDARNLGIEGFGKAGGKGGYDQYVKDLKKKNVETAKGLAPTDDEIEQAKYDLRLAKDESGNTIRSADAEIKNIEKDFENETSRVLSDIKKIEAEISYDENTLKNVIANGGDGAQAQRDIDTKKAQIGTLMQELNTTKRQDSDKLIEIAKKKKDDAVKRITDAQAKLDEVVGVNEKDAEKRFKEEGSQDAKEAEAKIKFNYKKKYDDAVREATDDITDDANAEANGKKLFGPERDQFVKNFIKNKIKEVEQKTKKAESDFVENYLKKEKADFIKGNTKDSLAKVRGLEYANTVERRNWIKAFDNYLDRTRKAGKASVLAGTRYTDSAAIRKEFNKSKEDEMLKKVIDDIKRQTEDGDKKDEKKDGGDKEKK